MAVGEEIQSRHFPAGSGDPVYVVAEAVSAEQVMTALSGVPGVVAVSTPMIKGGEALVLGELEDAPSSAAAMRTVERARAAVHKIDSSWSAGCAK